MAERSNSNRDSSNRGKGGQGSRGGSRSGSGGTGSSGGSTGGRRSGGSRDANSRSGDTRGNTSGKRSGSGDSYRSGSGGSGAPKGDRKHSGGKPTGGAAKTGRPNQREQLRTAGSGGGDLPKWIRDEILRTVPKDRRQAVLTLLGEAADEFADGRYRVARERLLRAKQMTSRSETVRELLGLSCYRLSNWDEALRELRAYRRIVGDTTHMAVEMDCLRALKRPNDVEKVWEMFRTLGGTKAAEVEMRVVYGAFLLDENRAKDAWVVTQPGAIRQDAHENDLRQWYVAARAAAELGDEKTARQLFKAIEDRDLGFPGLVELAHAIEALG